MIWSSCWSVSAGETGDLRARWTQRRSGLHVLTAVPQFSRAASSKTADRGQKTCSVDENKIKKQFVTSQCWGYFIEGSTDILITSLASSSKPAEYNSRTKWRFKGSLSIPNCSASLYTSAGQSLLETPALILAVSLSLSSRLSAGWEDWVDRELTARDRARVRNYKKEVHRFKGRAWL